MSLQKKKNLLKKNGGHCAYPRCGESTHLTIDHIIPKIVLTSLGFVDAYKTDDDNLQILCKQHNSDKGNLLDYTNPKTLPLLKKYINRWIEKHSDYFIDPAKRVRKLKPVCKCYEPPAHLDTSKWKNPPRLGVDREDY